MKSDVCSIALNNKIPENIEDFNTLEEAALALTTTKPLQVPYHIELLSKHLKCAKIGFAIDD